MGSMFPLWRIERTSANTVKLNFQNSTERDDFSTSEGENRVVIKGSTTAAADHKSIPLKVTGVDTSADLGGSLTVQTDDSFTSDLNGTVTAGSFGFVQVYDKKRWYYRFYGNRSRCEYSRTIICSYS